MKIVLAIGVTAFVVAFVLVSASGSEESRRFGYVVAVAAIVAVVIAGLWALWSWALE